MVQWTRYQTVLPTEAELQAWFGIPCQAFKQPPWGIAIVLLNDLFSIDIDLDTLKKAKTSVTQFHRIGGDGCRLPFKKNRFDAIINTEVIEHVKDPIAMLKEFNNVLKKGGYIMLTTPNRYRIANYIRKLIGREFKIPYYIHSGPGGYHLREYTKKELTKDLQKAGFKVIKFYSTYFGISFHDNIPIGTNRFARLFPKFQVSLAVLAKKVENK